jgi:hypothetical protein
VLPLANAAHVRKVPAALVAIGSRAVGADLRTPEPIGSGIVRCRKNLEPISSREDQRAKEYFTKTPHALGSSLSARSHGRDTHSESLFTKL